MYFGSIVYLYAHPPPGWQFVSVTTTPMVNSFGFGTEGGGGANVVRGVAVRCGFELLPKITTAAAPNPPSIPSSASVANTRLTVVIAHQRYFAVSTSVDGTHRSVLMRTPAPQEDRENDRAYGQQGYDGRAADEGNVLAAEAGRRRLAHQLHRVVARQRSLCRRLHARELLGLVDLELPLTGFGLRPFTPCRCHAIE